MTAFVPTKEQEAVIEYPGNLVAVARPGSGKTAVLAHKIYAILAKSPEHRGVIAISYTNKASDELKHRVKRLGGESKGSFFGTIDKFCVGELIIPFLRHMWPAPALDIGVTRVKDLPVDEGAAFEIDDATVINQAYVNNHVALLKAWFAKGHIMLETTGALALYVLTHSKASDRYIRARYSHVIIDEYQDSGLEQHELFRKLRELGLVAIAVGDADQSIYKFSKKDSRFLLELASDKANFRLFPITFNHRCHRSIINYSLRLLNEESEITPAEDGEIRVFLKTVRGGPAEIGAWIDAQVPSVMNHYAIEKPNRIGILVRGGATGEAIARSLKTRNRYFVPGPFDDDFNLWGRLFSALLTYRFNPKHSAQEVIDNCAAPLDETQTRTARKQIQQLRKTADEGLVASLEAVAELLLPNAKKEATVDRLRGASIDELKASFSPASEDEVQVMTIHKSKGLEFDVVFHLDLHEWVLPAKGPDDMGNWDNPQFKSFDQDRNLHYVGITRARKACILCTSTSRVNKDGKTKVGAPSELLSLKGLDKLRLVVE